MGNMFGYFGQEKERSFDEIIKDAHKKKEELNKDIDSNRTMITQVKCIEADYLNDMQNKVNEWIWDASQELPDFQYVDAKFMKIGSIYTMIIFYEYSVRR